MAWAPPTMRRKEAYEKLGIKPEQVASAAPITPQFRMIAAKLKKRNLPINPYFYLKCSDSQDARKIVELYYSLPRNKRNLIPLEGYCAAAGLDPRVVLDLIVRASSLVSRQAAAMLSSAAHPAVVEKNIDRALDDTNEKSDKYMEMLHKHEGFLPIPKGTQTTIQVTQNAQAVAQSVAIPAPPAEQTIRRLVNRFNEAKALPADTDSTRIPEVMPHEDLQEAELVEEEDEEEEAQMNP
jgi:hypothetical protein